LTKRQADWIWVFEVMFAWRSVPCRVDVGLSGLLAGFVVAAWKH
jgi:hypothetical protein